MRRDERFDKAYDEMVEIAKKNNLELHEIINFMLSFIIFNLSPALKNREYDSKKEKSKP